MFILGQKDTSKNLIFLSVLFDRTCVGHLDFVNGVKLGINQMTGSVSPTSSCLLEVSCSSGPSGSGTCFSACLILSLRTLALDLYDDRCQFERVANGESGCRIEA
jgi:hypothetical protein